jgi:inorganic pyrophosphatase
MRLPPNVATSVARQTGSDEKVTCASRHDPAWLRVHDVHDLQPEYRDEIEHFFQVYKDLERKKTATRGFGNRSDALEIIQEARDRLRSTSPGDP